jgi:NADPH-dependent ferric siderophore reductase/SAM-dependent methyltransferase
MQELPVRFIRVVDTVRITPHMGRVTFGGDDLADLIPRLAALGPDQQVKLYFPRPGQVVPALPATDGADLTSWYGAYAVMPEAERPWMRSYTIRGHDPERATIDIDFVLHDDAGPATRWALAARPGDVLAMFGPAAEFARPVPVSTAIAESDWFLMAGDESALPAIGTLAEALPSQTRAVAYVEVGDAADEQPIGSGGDLSVHWVHRGATPPGRSTALVDALRGARFPDGEVFAWLGGEAGAVRAMRRHLVEERGVAKRAIDFAGYWRPRRTQDDPPTEQDMADAQELLAKAQELAAQAQERQRRSHAIFDGLYAEGSAPWVIGEPQPTVVDLERAGRVRGRVLDPGCGTGENAVHLARCGHDVLAIDFSATAVAAATAYAAAQGVSVRFEVGDALQLDGGERFDTVVDSALFHVFGAEERARYVASLHRVCRPGASVHVLALSDEGPGFGPEIGHGVIREAFAGAGWVLEELRRSSYRGRVGGAGELGDLPAWLASVRRV